MRCVEVTIEGRVQGVGYRAWADETARGLGLRGWVRNRRDGGVDALFCGDAAAVRAMLIHCESGPPLARVTAIESRDVSGSVPDGFSVRETV